jgi:hypothetical protein
MSSLKIALLSLSLSVSAPLKKKCFVCLRSFVCLPTYTHTLRERTEEAVVFKKAAHTHSLAYTTSQPALKLPVCVRAAKPQTGAFCVSSNNTPSHTHTHTQSMHSLQENRELLAIKAKKSVHLECKTTN